MKKIVYLLFAIALIFSFTGCNKTVTNSDSSEESLLYKGNKGWKIAYDKQFFDINEISQGKNIELNYKGDCKGSAYIELAEVDNKSAKDLIKEKQKEYASTSDVYEVKNDGKSGYVFYVPGITVDKSDGNDRYTSVEVLSLKNGSLVITSSQMLDDEMEVSDRIADIINSVEI